MKVGGWTKATAENKKKKKKAALLHYMCMFAHEKHL